MAIIKIVTAVTLIIQLVASNHVEQRDLSPAGRITELNKISQESSVIPFNREDLVDFVMTPPREYTLIILFKRSGEKCGFCGEFRAVADFYRNQHGNSLLYFAEMELGDDKLDGTIKEKFNLQTPLDITFIDPSRDSNLNFRNFVDGDSAKYVDGFTFESVKNWVAKHSNLQISTDYPPSEHTEKREQQDNSFLIFVVIFIVLFLFAR